LLDHRTDVYSLGATLYELLTLRPAFDGVDRQQLLRQITDDEPLAPRKVRGSIPMDLETIALKALEKEPSQRYASASDLAGDLRRYLDSKPIHARRPGMADQIWKWSRRHKALLRAVGTVLVIAVIALCVSNYRISGALKIAQAATESEKAARLAETKAAAAEKLERVKATNAAKAEKEARLKEASERRKAEAVSNFLVDTFRLPRPEKEGRDLKVVDVLDQAVAKLGDDFAGAPQTRAALLVALGRTYARAESLLLEALVIQKNAESGFGFGLTSILGKLCVVYLDTGRFGKAIEAGEAALRADRQTLGLQVQTLETMNSLATAYSKAGRFDRAIELFEKSVRLAEPKVGQYHQTTLFAMANLGVNYGFINRASRAASSRST
jgi:pentatricopeptide repeat protein